MSETAQVQFTKEFLANQGGHQHHADRSSRINHRLDCQAFLV